MRPGTCKHYNGDPHNTHCLAGVCYADVTPEPHRREGIAFRKPCTRDWSIKGSPLSPGQQREFEKRGTCDRYQEPTAEEIKQFEAEMDAACKRVVAVAEMIGQFKKGLKRGEGKHGSVDCPICQKAQLHYVISSYNHHARVRCETPGCCAWIE